MSGKPEYLFDTRIVARNIKRERITRKEYEQHLKGLEDVADKAVPMFFEDEGQAGEQEDQSDE